MTEEQLRHFLSHGFKVPIIGQMLGISASTVRRRMTEYGLSSSGRGPDGPIMVVQECSTHTLFSPFMTTRGGTSPDGVEMTLIRERKSTHRQGWAFVAMSPNLATKTGQLEILATKRSNSGDNTRTQTLGSASRPRSLSLVSHPGISHARGTPCTRLSRVIVNTNAWRDKLVSRPSLPLRMST